MAREEGRTKTHLGELAVDDVLLPVQEPGGDLELGGVLHDVDDTLELVGVEFTTSRNIVRFISIGERGGRTKWRRLTAC